MVQYLVPGLNLPTAQPRIFYRRNTKTHYFELDEEHLILEHKFHKKNQINQLVLVLFLHFSFI